jgi:large subunit ribosomal protein L27
VGRGSDDTLFALKDGILEFTHGEKRKVHVRPAQV